MEQKKPNAARAFGSPLRFVAAVAILLAGILMALRLLRDGFYPLAAMLLGLALFLCVIVAKKRLSPYVWLSAGIALSIVFTVYPLFYTVYLSFTNMSGGHLLTKEQAIAKFQKEKYLPAEGMTYSWTAYRDRGGKFLLLLADPEGKTFIAREGLALAPYASAAGSAAATGEEEEFVPPDSIEGYALIDTVEALQRIQELSEMEFGIEPNLITVQGLGEAAAMQRLYAYDSQKDRITDNESGESYAPVDGTYVSASGEKLIPGFISGTGASNYSRFLGNPGYFKPIIEIILWNISFSALSVLIAFALGLVIALLFEDVPGKRIIRSLLIIPYPIPVLVSIMVWRALLNEKMGLVTGVLTSIFGSAPKFFTDTAWTRFAVILINVYLSYPYFYILCSGALKSIPSDLYEAARIDGAGPWATLRSITLPMLLRILAPLLIASFSFNFNNFTIIWGFNAGLPPMADTIVPMGHTDLLISFIYRLGFGTANAADYGFSAAITVLLFVLVGTMVLLQTMRTKSIKEAD